jgi:hypothetical protein
MHTVHLLVALKIIQMHGTGDKTRTLFPNIFKLVTAVHTISKRSIKLLKPCKEINSKFTCCVELHIIMCDKTVRADSISCKMCMLQYVYQMCSLLFCLPHLAPMFMYCKYISIPGGALYWVLYFSLILH